MAFTKFTDLDPGASQISGSSGVFLTVLDEILILKRLFTAAAAEGGFNDNSAEARLNAGTPFTLFPTPANNDRFYVGLQATFSRIRFNMAVTASGAAAYVWEYYNGSAWTALSVTDTTAGFTTSGIVSWTIPGDWAFNTVNSVSSYWVRCRATTVPSGNPTVYSCTTQCDNLIMYTNAGAERAYQSQTGLKPYIYIRDNGDLTGGFRDAKFCGFETMSGINAGVNPFPNATYGGFTTNNFSSCGFQAIRKSGTLDGTTHSYQIFADCRTVYIFIYTGEIASSYLSAMWGEFTPGNALNNYSCVVAGRAQSTAGNATAHVSDWDRNNATWSTAHTGIFIDRGVYGMTTGCRSNWWFGPANFTNAGLAAAAIMGNQASTAHGPAFPNPASNEFYVAPVYLLDNGTLSGIGVTIGTMRGAWLFGHNQFTVADGAIFQGSGAFTGRSFQILKFTPNQGVFCIETSDTLLPQGF